MPTQDTSQIKEKIISIIKFKGPSLPVHISQGIGTSMLFASAFLSELLSEKKLKISNMKVGNSPIYFIPGQETKLENYANHLKSKEKDAFQLLKEKSFLKDTEQEPAIRVALRSIKDFAVPFKKDDEIFWRYVSVPESDFKYDKKIVEKSQKIHAEEDGVMDKKESGIIEENQKPKKRSVKKSIKKKSSLKVNEKFFEKVKEYLFSKGIEILDIVGFSKSDLTLKVKENDEEKLLVAYNKKSIKEEDIIKAHKKSLDMNLRYFIVSLGEPLKKLNAFIDAVRNLEKINKIN